MTDNYQHAGSSAGVYCSNCGHAVEAGSVFCGYCGKKIVYPKTPASYPKAGAFNDQTDDGQALWFMRKVVGKAAGQIVCIILMILLAIKLIMAVVGLISVTSTFNQLAAMLGMYGSARTAMQNISAIVIIIGLLGMMPYILEVIGVWTAVIGGITNKIKTTGFTLINAGLIISLIGVIIKNTLYVLGVIIFGGIINNEITRSGAESIMPYIVAIVLCIVSNLVLAIFFYRGLMRPGSCAKRMMTEGRGEIKLSVYAMIVLGLNAVFKIIGWIVSRTLSPERIFLEFTQLIGPISEEVNQQMILIINGISNYLRSMTVQQSIRNGIDILVLILAITVMIMFKNSCKRNSYTA